MKLKIGGHYFNVIYKEIEDCGFLDRTKNEIVIDERLTHSQKEATLIHEILHALDNEMDHSKVDSLAEQLYQVLKDNKLKFY